MEKYLIHDVWQKSRIQRCVHNVSKFMGKTRRKRLEEQKYYLVGTHTQIYLCTERQKYRLKCTQSHFYVIFYYQKI